MPFNLKEEIYKAVKEIKWNFKGILDKEGRLHEIPKNLNFQALFERLALEKLAILTKRYNIKVQENLNIRSYPDIVLTGGSLGKSVVALDIKTGRRVENKTGFTLGSYAGYIRNPDKKLCCGGLYSYNDFTHHWDICFIYDWDEKADTLNMIKNIQIVIQEKWRLASKSTGTGTTTAIGSIKDIDRIIKGAGDFKSEKEFLSYWRNYLRGNKK